MTAHAERYPSEPVGEPTATLLDALADGSSADADWERFVRAVRRVAAGFDGRVDQNKVRAELAGRIPSRRAGPFYRRAVKAGLLRVDGFNVNDDVKSRNRGKPQRHYRWQGGDRDE